MELQRITNNVFYAGINDRVTHLFERMWPIPDGVSYNSYLVCGEKTALIDCVELSEVERLISNIKGQIGNSDKLDYLVVNHMEPDHSGGLPALVDAFPQMKIVGNELTIKMIEGFYGINDNARFLKVRNGETLDLGNGKKLTFVLTPMVHWPETMMTWLEEDKILFSGDAFGMFGTCNGTVIDTPANPSCYPAEMYRYYANIVGKYGKFVQDALKKASSLDIEFICPTHGPVWHEKISEVVDLYSRMSNYEPEDGVVIVYGSMYGNTARLADRIANAFARTGVKNIKIHDVSHSHLSYIIADAFRYKYLVIGSATYQMGLFPPVESLLNALVSREIKNKVVGVFSSYTWSPGIVRKATENYLSKINIPIVSDLEMKQCIECEVEGKINQFVNNIIQFKQ